MPTIASAFNVKNSITMITMDQVPYGFLKNNGKPTGMLYDILNRIMIESEIEQTNKLLSMKRILATMLSKQSSCSLLANSPVIVNNYDSIEAIGLPINGGILPRAGVILTDYSSLKGLTIAVPLGVSFDDNFSEKKNLVIVSPRNYVNALKMLKTGQVDAVAGAISTLKFIALKNEMRATDFGQPLVLSKHEVMLVCNQELPKVTRNKLKKAVINLRSSGEIQAVIDVYTDKKTTKQ